MRMTTLAAAVYLALALPVQAQQAAQALPPSATPVAVPAESPAARPDDGIRTEATVVVTGEQPGPGLWLVRNGNHELYILGTITPLPTKMQWQTRQIDEIIANAQEVIHAPSISVNSDIGKFRALMLLPSLVGVKNNPDGKRLDAALPPATYVRWSAFRDRFLDRDADKLRPMFAADALWKAAIKRSGLSNENVAKAAVAAAVERHNPKVTVVRETITVKDPKAAIKQFKAAEIEDMVCLEGTLDRLGQDMEILRQRANAWATGDIAAIRAMPLNDQYQACLEAITGSGIGRSLGMADAMQRLQTAWMAKADAALSTNAITFAVLEMRDLLQPGGYLDRLKARGYTVIAPDE